MSDGIPFASFAVDDVRAEHERLEGLDVRFTPDPVRTGPVTMAVFEDDCGDPVQIAERDRP